MGGTQERAASVEEEGNFEERQKSSYKDKVMGMGADVVMEDEDADLYGDASDDDEIYEDDDGPWISLGMTKEEKIEAMKPWRLSLIIKLVGRKIGYQFLLRHLQSLWKPQQTFSLIDLCNDYFIARFSNKQDYEVALLNGPWVISDHYLHVQRCVPDLMPMDATIDSLLVWVRFSILPVEYYTARWIERAGNKLGRTIKVDRATLMASQGKFARVCIEVDLTNH